MPVSPRGKLLHVSGALVDFFVLSFFVFVFLSGDLAFAAAAQGMLLDHLAPVARRDSVLDLALL